MSSNKEVPVCVRPRCKRTRGLSKWQLCGAHACPTPGCKESKSNKERVCEVHTAMAQQKLPKGWILGTVESGIFIYVDTKHLCCQYNHPGPKGEKALPRTSISPPKKPSKGMPLVAIILPQPENMPEGWEQVLVVPVAKSKEHSAGPQIAYQNTAENMFQTADPRPASDDYNLPDGWSMAYDVDGDVYYIDHNSKTTTYDDPRLVSEVVASKVLAATHRPRSQNARASKKKKEKGKPWKISENSFSKFKALDNNLTMPEEIPECVRNKKHNRYMDILPNPKTRVPLDKIGDDETSEYINANFVRSFDGNPTFYVAAMGPKPLTVNNFWRMLMKHKICCIVMTTGLLEKGKTKCERYWPAQADGKTSLTFGTIKVVTESSKPHPGFIRSVIKATDGSESHTLVHYWYNTWPDHGVPTAADGSLYVDDVLGMMKVVHKEFKNPSTPILVHCSAGIGRTGTIIAIDHATRILELSAEVDLFEVIKTIREDRCALVQHLQQFDFVHRACIRHAELCGHRAEVEGQQQEDDVFEEPFSPEEAEAARKEEKAASKRRMSEVHGVRLLSKSQLAGELRLGTVTYNGEQLQFLDLDGDGKMDYSEAKAQGISDEAFNALDANKDGVITIKEFLDFQKAQKS
eukprot:m.85200 g.85200  ORF g.85200 m.85200 type:complete len:633 (-) comp21251_c0_seq2:242-2140(-)